MARSETEFNVESSKQNSMLSQYLFTVEGPSLETLYSVFFISGGERTPFLACILLTFQSILATLVRDEITRM